MRRSENRWPPCHAAAVVACAAVLCLCSATAEATRPAGFRVFCDPSTGEVAADTELSQGQRIAMTGLFPGFSTAEVWIDENCPDRRCDASGLCAGETAEPADGAWFVLCNQRSGDVGLVNASSLAGFSVMAGPYATQKEAESWVAASCPGWRCDRSGACLGAAGHTPSHVTATASRGTTADRWSAGVLVHSVAPGSHAAAAGFRHGDTILAINGVPPMSPEQAGQLIAAARLGTWLEFTLERNRQQLTLGALRTVDPLGLSLAPLVPQTGGGSHPATGASDGWVAGAVETTGSGSRGQITTGAGGGWAVGELTTVGGAEGAGGAAGPTGPVNVVGPQSARVDVTPLASAAKIAAAACAFPAALANADQMAAIDPSNPWLESNHDRIQQLASRQKATEEAVWRASKALADDDLKAARKVTLQAADTALSCQYEAVSTLLKRIDETIAHHKAEKSAANRRAAGALLPGLLALNQAVTGQYGGSSTQLPVTSGSTEATMAAVGAAIGGPPDPCTFNYSYPNRWSTEPICSCNGYRFDPTQLRCIR